MSQRSPYPGTQSVRRVLRLLKLFTDERPEWELREISRAAGLNKSTAYRLLAALEREGMVMRVSARGTGARTGGYRLGPEAIALGARAMRASDVRSAARPALESIAAQTGETATLEVLSGAETLVLDEVQGVHRLGSTQFTGKRWPAPITPTGRVLLAELEPAEARALLPDPMERYTEATITEPAVFKEELAAIRRQGYAVLLDESEIGFVEFAAPLRDHDGKAVAAIAFGGPTSRLPRDQVAEYTALVSQEAGRTSERLGYRKQPAARS